MCAPSEKFVIPSFQLDTYAKLDAFRLKKKLCDFDIPIEGKVVSAHKVVLLQRLPIFKRIFKGEVPANEALKDVTYRAFVAVVDYLYTGKLALTPENAGDVLLAVRVLEMPDQYAECKAFFLKRLSTENIPSILQFAKKHGFKDIQLQCMNSIVDHFDEFTDHNFLTPDEMVTCLSNDWLHAKEETVVFGALSGWLESCQNSHEHIQALFDCIRLEHLTRDYILNTVSKHKDIATSGECRKRIESFLAQERSTEKHQQCRNRKTKDYELLYVTGEEAGWKLLIHNAKKRRWTERMVLPHSGCNGVASIGPNLYYCRAKYGYRGAPAKTMLKRVNVVTKETVDLKAMENFKCSFQLLALKGRLFKCDAYGEECEIYTPETNTWESGPKYLKSHDGSAINSVNDRYIVVAGGSDNLHNRLVAAEYLDCEDLQQGWRAMTPLAKPRDASALVAIPPRGRLLLLGGYNNQGIDRSIDLYTPDPTPSSEPWNPIGQWTEVIRNLEGMYWAKFAHYFKDNTFILGQSCCYSLPFVVGRFAAPENISHGDEETSEDSLKLCCGSPFPEFNVDKWQLHILPEFNGPLIPEWIGSITVG